MFTSVPLVLTPQSLTGVTWGQAQVDAMHTVGFFFITVGEL